MNRRPDECPFFEYVTDCDATIEGFYVQGPEDRRIDILNGLNAFDVLAAPEPRISCAFRFLRIEHDWGTAWRKSKNANSISLDAVFLVDHVIPFFAAPLIELSPGLQRLVIGLTAHELFKEVIQTKSRLFEAWGHDPEELLEKISHWFSVSGYTGIQSLFSMFEQDENLADCNMAIPWLTFDDIVFLYERHVLASHLFTFKMDSSLYYSIINENPNNKKINL